MSQAEACAGTMAMRRSITIALSSVALTLVALALSGCGLADSHSTFVPQAFRAPEPPPLQVETPDVRALVEADPNGLFLHSANPTNIRISQAQQAIPGGSWTACVKANVTGMSGNAINDQVLQVEIIGGKIRDRRRADANSPCMFAVYEPL
jgi:hypothetical protein